MSPPFLTATWSNLIFINFEVPPELLIPYLPLGVELDYFNDTSLVSVVALRFSKMRLGGIVPAWPVTNFEELNLRFYVRRQVGDEVRRGVVFIKEVVPSRLIAATARVLYNEPYEAREMTSSCENFDRISGGSLSYHIQIDQRSAEVSASTSGPLRDLEELSVERFILEHYWGYARQEDGSTSEYRVRHPSWKFWSVSSVALSSEVSSLYHPDLSPLLRGAPHSACVAQGSPVSVYTFKKIAPKLSLDRAPREKTKGWVLYDGRCGFCSWMSKKLRRRIERAGFSIAAIQSAWVHDVVPIPEARLADDIRVITPEGLLLSGADAYIYGFKKVLWLAPVGILLGLPGFRWLTWRGYKLFSRTRLFVSKVCGLSPEI
jgi:uncharacterized protein YqjF (DUF2071 family)/predicted DCC family thiol-disulfide oxidoreductase YuxK